MTSSPATARPTRGMVERGMMWMALAMLIVPSTDATAKYLSASLSPGEIACARLAFQAVFLLPVMLWTGRALGRHLVAQVMRGLALAGITIFFFAAIQVMPLADSFAIFFVEPLILTVMSALFLGEPIGWRRVAAVIVGFAGAMLVLQPSYRVFGIEALFPLASATCFAVYMVLTRWLTARRAADGVTLQFTAAGTGGLVLGFLLVFGAFADVPALSPSWPTPTEWLILAAVGALGLAVHLMIIRALHLAPAGIIAPFQYLEIITATALGFAVFGDFPSATTWVGIAVIVGSGLYVFHRERLLERAGTAVA